MEGQRRNLALILIVMILVQGSYAKECDCSKSKPYAAAAVGGVGLLGVVTGGILVLGFGPAGILANSLAAAAMSTATTAGVGGGMVALAQSAGAAGLTMSAKTAIVGTGAAVSYVASGGCDCDC